MNEAVVALPLAGSCSNSCCLTITVEMVAVPEGMSKGFPVLEGGFPGGSRGST